jgi:SAM-dependent methyltransferase
MGDIRSTGFPDATFDAYFSWGVFEHFESGLQDCVREAFRIVKPGGLLFVSVPLDNLRHAILGSLARPRQAEDRLRFYQWRLTRAELARELGIGGFEVLDVQPINKRQGVLRSLHHEFGLPYEWLLTKGLSGLLAPAAARIADRPHGDGDGAQAADWGAPRRAGPMKTPVSQYFDSIADDYDHRYDASARPYHSYLHQQRLQIAAGDIDFAGRRILDIGAGTGSLYDFIVQRVPDPDYFACDVSGEMLAQSRIPPQRRAVGGITEISPPHAAFDLIFMLGVSTYLSPEAWQAVLTRVTTLLAPDGRFIVSFTNPRSLDWHVPQHDPARLARQGRAGAVVRDLRLLAQGRDALPAVAPCRVV